jgi:hypothetical protein
MGDCKRHIARVGVSLNMNLATDASVRGSLGAWISRYLACHQSVLMSNRRVPGKVAVRTGARAF